MPLDTDIPSLAETQEHPRRTIMQDIIYFELNNWFAERDYPDKEPYLTWMKDSHLMLRDIDFVSQNKLCVLACWLDMSTNFCVTAPTTWVEQHCPTLLAEDSKFLRQPDDTGVVRGKFSHIFLPYTPEYIGKVYWLPQNFGYNYQYETQKYVESIDDFLAPIQNPSLYEYLKGLGQRIYYSYDYDPEDLWDDWKDKSMPYEMFEDIINKLLYKIKLRTRKLNYPQDFVLQTKNYF